ncbi:MAG TPA: GTPase Era, partial [Clostridia bacterium]|nr:GTPase Era [Clostridia bacterium]
FHRPRNRLGEYMVKTVSDSILDVDAAIFVVEPVEGANDYEKALLDKFRSAAIPVILVINKIDTLAQKQQLAGVIQTWSERFDFHAIVPASAARCEGIADVVKEAVGLMPEGPQYYPEDMFTTEPERAVVAEIIREKLLRLMSEEIPHGTAVSIERMKEREEGGVIDIDAVIFCEKESHKGMIIGKGGQMLKKVGSQARMDIERLLDCHVNLKLWVKVKEDWRNRESILKSLGYE